jgi:hypothetical protein
MANLMLTSNFCLLSSNPSKLDLKKKLDIWHAPWGYSGVQTEIEFTSLPRPEVGVARRFCAISAPGLLKK